MGVWSDRWWKIEFQNNHTTTSSSSCTLWHPSPIPSLLCRVLLCCAISNSRIVYNSWEKNDNHVPMEWSWRQDQTKELSVVDHTHTHTHTHNIPIPLMVCAQTKRTLWRMQTKHQDLLRWDRIQSDCWHQEKHTAHSQIIYSFVLQGDIICIYIIWTRNGFM